MYLSDTKTLVRGSVSLSIMASRHSDTYSTNGGSLGRGYLID